MSRTNLGGVFIDEVDHFAGGGADADEDGAGDDAVADVEVFDAFEGSEGGDVAVGDAVAEVDGKAMIPGEVAGADDFFDLAVDLEFGIGVGIGAGVDFDGIAAGGGGGDDLIFVGGDESGDGDAGFAEAGNGVGEAALVFGGVEAPFGGEFLAAFGDEGDLLGFEFEGEADHGFGEGHFEVEHNA